MNKKLFIAMSAAAAGLTTPVVAHAEVKASAKTMILASSPTDFAPITGNATADKPARLRRTDEEQPGNEMAHVAFFKNSTKGLYFSMSTDMVDPAAPTVGHPATDRIQLALVPVELTQDTAGVVSVKANYTGLGTNTAQTGGARFVTNNKGNEYRNANHPAAYALSDKVMCVEYNYQPNNTNNTERYMQCFDDAGKQLMAQTKIYAKNNDDCSMNQDAASSWVVNAKPDGGAGLISRVVAWRGCNGNGDDDGWAQSFDLKVDNAAAPTKVTFQQKTDVSLCPREERSHGFCSTGTDDNVAICSWTEGNTQPQRDGVWMAAIDLTKTGQQSILWKQQIDGRKDLTGVGRTYAMRAMTDRISLPNATTGELERTDMVMWRSGQLRGNNNSNQKGGTYYANNMAVIKATRQGLQYVVPMTDMSAKLTGLDGTHLGFRFAEVGTTDALKPSIMILGGSHFGGGYGAQMTMVSWDQATNTMVKGESREGAPYDRHLYPNYLGNNPGNQGRNYLGAEFIKNPFVTAADAGKDQYLMVLASTGKEPTEMPSATCIDCAKRKLSAYITVIPVAQNAAGSTAGTGTGSGSGSGSGTGSDTATGSDSTGTGDDTGATDPGTSLGGCSAGGQGSSATLLLLGLAAIIRRRNRK